MRISFGTKSETLEYLAPHLKSAEILPQLRLNAGEWADNPDSFLTQLLNQPWARGSLIVRSSAADEDRAGSSLAGHYTSIADVRGAADLRAAIDKVFSTFPQGHHEHQVFVQPYLSTVACCGVAFSCDPNTNAPYIVINYDTTGATDSVTSGCNAALETCYSYRHAPSRLSEPLRSVDILVRELLDLLPAPAIDVEFAVDTQGIVYLLQVRPLVVSDISEPDASEHQQRLASVAETIARGNRRHPYLCGTRTIYGVMPDWNPAEIIGIRPRPLALSLYKDLVTDSIWAYQRHNYGYRNVRSFPLIVDFYGLPYVDVRVSFNSFIPADIDSELADRLVDHYITQLAADPSRHDKVEFEIVHSCYTLDLPTRLEQLDGYGFTATDRNHLAASLRGLTNRIIHGESGLWIEDASRIDELAIRYDAIRTSSLDTVAQIYWLLEDCKRYGTLPFAGLARGAFIAVQFLQSMVAVGVLDRSEQAQFLASLNTVSSQMAVDSEQLQPDAFLAKYGHLRPGTYEITSPRYDEAADQYFEWSSPRPPTAHLQKDEFSLTLSQFSELEKLLVHHGLQHNVLSLFHFLKCAIEGREYAKFVFTRNLSLALSLVRKLGLEHGLSPEDCSFLHIKCVTQLHASSASVLDALQRSIARGRERWEQAKQLLLPPLITTSENTYHFHLPPTDPNFITLRTIAAPVRTLEDARGSLEGCILLIPSADPGYDWIFSHRISGLVTMYGGANSHMAIRASELGIPAVIGAGAKLFELWQAADTLELDCVNRKVRIVRMRASTDSRARAAA